MKNAHLERLLRAAAETTPAPPNEMPFGFDTRVMALWRSEPKRDLVDPGPLLNRVTLLSLAVIALAGVGFYDELRQTSEPEEPFLDQYSIADTAISNAVEP